MTWQTGDLKIAGTPTNFWLTNGDGVPAVFSVVDPDSVEWGWAAFIGQQRICEGRAPLSDALSAAMQAAGVPPDERRRLFSEFEQLIH